MAKGYQSYRGRSSLGRKLFIILLVLILLIACGFMALQRFITYRDDGGMSIVLPFWQLDLPAPAQTPPPEEDTPENPLPAIDLVVEPPEEPDEPEEPVDVFGEHKLVELASLPADGAALTQLLSEKGATGFLYTVRDHAGKVYFSADVVQPQAAPAGTAGTEAMRTLCALEDVTAVARFNCLHDSYYAFAHMAEAAICQANGYVWYDNISYHWLDADKEQARQYVVSLAVECAKLGYDELLLEELSYPARGNLNKISYAKNTLGKTEALELLLKEMKEALEPYGTKLSLLVTEDLLLNGRDEVSGVDLTVLLPLVDGVYADVPSAAAAQALVDALVEGEEKPVFVPLTSEPAEGNWCLIQ